MIPFEPHDSSLWAAWLKAILRPPATGVHPPDETQAGRIEDEPARRPLPDQ
jgi:hypothetical protein